MSHGPCIMPAHPRPVTGQPRETVRMARKTGIYAVFLSAMLMLAACGGEAAPEETAEPAAPTAAESTQATAEPKTYTDDDLKTVISGLEDAQGQQLSVIPAAQLDQGLAAAKELLANATITPEACSMFATEQTQIPEGSTYAAGASQSAEEKSQTIITLTAVKDPQIIADQLEQAQESMQQCAEFEIEAQGQKISSKITPLEVTTDGEQSIGSITTQELPNGQNQKVMSVAGTQGTLAATAVKIGPDVEEKAQDELIQLVNDALAQSQ